MSAGCFLPYVGLGSCLLHMPYIHQFAKKELIAMNRNDIVEKWLQTTHEIYEEYKNYPHMVELQDQKYVKTVNRYSKFLEITDTGLKI